MKPTTRAPAAPDRQPVPQHRSMVFQVEVATEFIMAASTPFCGTLEQTAALLAEYRCVQRTAFDAEIEPLALQISGSNPL